MSASLVGSRVALKCSWFAEPAPEPETKSNIRNDGKIVATRQHECCQIARKAFR